MTAKAIDRLALTSMTPLSDLQRAQLAVIGRLYFGNGEPPRIAADDSEGDPMETRSLLSCELWRIVDDEHHLYDAWLYMGDSGTVFVVGTTNKVAEVIQDYLESDDKALRTTLREALKEAKLISG